MHRDASGTCSDVTFNNPLGVLQAGIYPLAIAQVGFPGNPLTISTTCTWLGYTATCEYSAGALSLDVNNDAEAETVVADKEPLTFVKASSSYLGSLMCGTANEKITLSFTNLFATGSGYVSRT